MSNNIMELSDWCMKKYGNSHAYSNNVIYFKYVESGYGTKMYSLVKGSVKEADGTPISPIRGLQIRGPQYLFFNSRYTKNIIGGNIL